MTLPNVALSLRQPWAHAVVHGGKRIENRSLWKNCHRRGPILIHAALGMTRKEYDVAHEFAIARKLSWRPPHMQPISGHRMHNPELPRGGIVGVATIVGVVPRGGRPWIGRTGVADPRDFTPEEERWWFGGFALVLDDVRPLPFVACKGALGFFNVPDDVVRKALGR